MSIFLSVAIVLLLTEGAICAHQLRAYRRQQLEATTAALREIAELGGQAGAALAPVVGELRDFLVRGTNAATASQLGAIALDCAARVDDGTIRAGWGAAVKRWDTMFQIECEKLSLRASGPQYRAARAIAMPVITDRCVAAGASSPPLITLDDPDDLDATRDGSSGVAS